MTLAACWRSTRLFAARRSRLYGILRNRADEATRSGPASPGPDPSARTRRGRRPARAPRLGDTGEGSVARRRSAGAQDVDEWPKRPEEQLDGKLMDHAAAQHDDHRSILRQARSPRHVTEQLSLVPHGRGVPVGWIEQSESVPAIGDRHVRIECRHLGEEAWE